MVGRIRKVFVLMCLCICAGVPALAQEKKGEAEKKITKQEGYVQSLNEAWGYFMSRKMLVELVALRFQELKVPSVHAWADFKKKEIGQSLAGLAAIINSWYWVK